MRATTSYEMIICFNMSGVGLANNGGSRTLIRCVEVLRELGHDAFFHSGKSYYTWHKADIKLVGGKKHPRCDVSIATGINSVKAVHRFTKGHRAYYVRGLELWKANEEKLLKSFRSVDHVFVNSEWLYTYMRENGISVTLQYPGLDWHWFTDLHQPRAGVGAMMHNKHRTKRSADAVEVERLLGLQVWYLNRHIKHPDSPTLNVWYNRLKVWLAPTELEGLHNPPMEASLAGCALVCTDHPRNGMNDYVVDGETALVYPARDMRAAADCVRRLLDDDDLRQRLNHNMVELLRRKIGTREERMREFATRLEQL